MYQLLVPPTEFDQTKRIRRCPWCWDEAAPSGLGVATPQAMKSAIAAGYHGAQNRLKTSQGECVGLAPTK